MKHIFVWNPTAGNGKSEKHIIPQILAVCKEHQLDYELHRTVNVGEATTYVKRICREFASEDALRFYALGGDGTINEVAAGLLHAPNAQLAVMPCGSGNDFARMIGPEFALLNLEAQLAGSVQPVDVLQVNDRICVNMINIGLDGSAAAAQAQIKASTALSGTPTYVAALIPRLVKMEPAHLTVTLEDGTCYSGDYTLCAMGNGSFCGGGFKSLPKASVTDGLLDVGLVNRLHRRQLFRLIGSYAKGTHLTNEFVLKKNLLTYVKCKSLTIQTDGQIAICVDGEILRAPELSISVLHQELPLVVPQGCAL